MYVIPSLRGIWRFAQRCQILRCAQFANLPGFLEWDIYRPRHLPEDFDLILCDPPFFNVSLSQLFVAIRLLCRFDLTRRLMISYPTRRAGALLATFAPFGLRPTKYRPGYLTVQKCRKNDIEFYANFGANIGASCDDRR